MSIKDILENYFINGWSTNKLGLKELFFVMLITSILAVYIFVAYRLLTKKTFYSNSFNIALAGVSLITAAIIIAVQSNVVISLGMVGALSIVRFRTAIKDPMDLMFLFWSISIGIICGAGLAVFAILLSVVMTILVIILNKFPLIKSPMILLVTANNYTETENNIMNTVKKFYKRSEIKARNSTSDILDLTIELRTSEGSKLINELLKLEGVTNVSLMTHNGETSF